MVRAAAGVGGGMSAAVALERGEQRDQLGALEDLHAIDVVVEGWVAELRAAARARVFAAQPNAQTIGVKGVPAGADGALALADLEVVEADGTGLADGRRIVLRLEPRGCGSIGHGIAIGAGLQSRVLRMAAGGVVARCSVASTAAAVMMVVAIAVRSRLQWMTTLAPAVFRMSTFIAIAAIVLAAFQEGAVIVRVLAEHELGRRIVIDLCLGESAGNACGLGGVGQGERHGRAHGVDVALATGTGARARAHEKEEGGDDHDGPRGKPDDNGDGLGAHRAHRGA
jgi:hypothetical protein